jgi:hypothetical protein
MKITKNCISQCETTEQANAEEEALQSGLEEMSKGFVSSRAKLYAKVQV